MGTVRVVGVLDTFLLGLLTALATGVGVFPVYAFEMGDRPLGFLWGVSASVMAAISVLDLILPAADDLEHLGLGVGSGLIFVILAAIWIDDHNHGPPPPDQGGPGHVAEASATGSQPDHGHAHGHAALGSQPLSSLSLLLFLVFTVHSAPEGVGIGSALKESSAIGLIVTFAIALHNVPEGTAIAVGLRADEVPLWRAVGAAVVTSLPQPLLAPIVFVVAVGPWLSVGMGFAAGAMLALVVRELVPEGLDADPRTFAVGVVTGLVLAILLNVLFPVPTGV